MKKTFLHEMNPFILETNENEISVLLNNLYKCNGFTITIMALVYGASIYAK